MQPESGVKTWQWVVTAIVIIVLIIIGISVFSGKTPAPRTQNTPPPTSRAGVTQVRDLNAALMQLEIGTAVKPGTPEAEAKEIGRKARMAWVNEQLANEEMPPVAGMGELAPEVISRLILVAKAAKGVAQ